MCAGLKAKYGLLSSPDDDPAPALDATAPAPADTPTSPSLSEATDAPASLAEPSSAMLLPPPEASVPASTEPVDSQQQPPTPIEAAAAAAATAASAATPDEDEFEQLLRLERHLSQQSCWGGEGCSPTASASLLNDPSPARPAPPPLSAQPSGGELPDTGAQASVPGVEPSACSSASTHTSDCELRPPPGGAGDAFHTLGWKALNSELLRQGFPPVLEDAGGSGGAGAAAGG